jgi:hypothetical protein
MCKNLSATIVTKPGISSEATHFQVLRFKIVYLTLGSEKLKKL